MNDSPVDQMREWREDWVSKMMQHSLQPLIFWEAVVNRVITDRLRLASDPTSPLGPNALDSTKSFALLAERNESGLHWEVVGDITKAMILYESNVADCFSNLLAYERLRIIYTDRRWYEDALRVCEAYLVQGERPGMGSHEYLHYHAQNLIQELRQQNNDLGTRNT